MFGPSLKKVAKWRQEKNTDSLIKALDTNDFRIKAAAIDALGSLKIRTAVSDITPMLKHPISSDIRATSAVALGNIRDNSSIKHLIKALGDDVPSVVQAAEKALLLIGDPATKHIRDQLNNYFQDSVRVACRNILKSQGKRVVPYLVEGLMEGTYGIREESANLLGKIGDATGRDALVAALNDKRLPVRKAAAQALQTINWQPGNDIYAAQYYISINRIGDAFKLGPKVLPAFVSWIDCDDMKVRRNIAVALHKFGWRPQTRKEAADFYAAAGKFSELPRLGEDAIDTITRLLSDKNLRVKKAAARALKKIGVPSNLRQLVREIDLLVDFTIFKLTNGTFNLETIGLVAEHYNGKYYLLKVENCDEEQTRHIQNLYPEAVIVSEQEAL